MSKLLPNSLPLWHFSKFISTAHQSLNSQLCHHYRASSSIVVSSDFWNKFILTFHCVCSDHRIDFLFWSRVHVRQSEFISHTKLIRISANFSAGARSRHKSSAHFTASMMRRRACDAKIYILQSHSAYAIVTLLWRWKLKFKSDLYSWRSEFSICSAKLMSRFYFSALLSTIGAKVSQLIPPFDASRNGRCSLKCKLHSKQFIESLGNFDLWAYQSKYRPGGDVRARENTYMK